MAAVFQFGGDEGDRTPDLLNAIQALSQLSYAPKALHALLYGKKRALSIVFLLLFTLTSDCCSYQIEGLIFRYSISYFVPAMVFHSASENRLSVALSILFFLFAW